MSESKRRTDELGLDGDEHLVAHVQGAAVQHLPVARRVDQAQREIGVGRRRGARADVLCMVTRFSVTV